MPFILSAFSMIAVFAVLFIFRKRWPIGLAIFFAYIILLIPAMGFFEHPYYPVDRYSLAPSICLSILIAFGLISLIKNKYFSVISISILVVIISVLGWLSFNQVKVWNNSESLFTHMIRTLGNDPYKGDIYWRLGKYLYEHGKKEEAITNFENTLAINQYHPIANKYLAEIEYNNGNLTTAIYYLQNILIVEPNNYEVHYYLSMFFNKLNKKKEAAYHYECAVNLQRAMLNAQTGTNRP
jgi:tetratricopeptide (TPR) repeat protein